MADTVQNTGAIDVNEKYSLAEAFQILTRGGLVRAQVHDIAKSVTVEMGQVSFHSEEIPVAGKAREVLDEQITVLDKDFRYSAATIGNPHCVILCEKVSKKQALKYARALNVRRDFQIERTYSS